MRDSPLDEDCIINQAICGILQKGIIIPSKNDWILVAQDWCMFHFYVDFKQLNIVTMHALYPLPHVNDLENKIKKLDFLDMACLEEEND